MNKLPDATAKMVDLMSDFLSLSDARLYAKQAHNKDLRFSVISMFTASHESHATRLKASLDKFKLNYNLYQVPSVHQSISTKGTDDLTYCKPNFIYNVMTDLNQPVLYVDTDIVVREFPAKIDELLDQNVDFAAYNWLADSSNAAYEPITINANGQSFTKRFYRCSHRVDLQSSSQLICSGAMQFYRNSEYGIKLLEGWLNSVRRWPSIADDELLDYAFNFSDYRSAIKTSWLGKEYCRYGWWINTRPVLDHPELPEGGGVERSFARVTGQQRFDAAQVKKRLSQGVFPQELFIDVESKTLFAPAGNSLLPVRQFTDSLWLP